MPDLITHYQDRLTRANETIGRMQAWIDELAYYATGFMGDTAARQFLGNVIRDPVVAEAAWEDVIDRRRKAMQRSEDA